MSEYLLAKSQATTGSIYEKKLALEENPLVDVCSNEVSWETSRHFAGEVHEVSKIDNPYDAHGIDVADNVDTTMCVVCRGLKKEKDERPPPPLSTTSGC